MLNIQVIFGCAALFLIVTSAVYFYWVHKKPEKFTRDRFAFAGLAVLASLSLAFIHTFSGTTPWDILYAALSWGMTGKFDPPPATGEGRLLIIFCISIVAYTIIKLHQTWPGKITEDQWKSGQLNERPNLVLEGITEIKRLLVGGAELRLHDPSKKREFAKIEPATATAQFNILARDLFCEVRRDAVFEKDENVSWHTRGHFWFGRDRRTENSIVLFCTGSNFSSTELQASIDYLRALKAPDLRSIDFFQIRRRQDDFVIAKVDGHAVSSWVLDSLLDSLIDIENYRETIYQRVAVDVLPNSELTIQRTYTESKVIAEQTREASRNFSAFVTEWLSDGAQGHIALLGEYGQGKSTSVLMFVHDVLQKNIRCPRLPILIELRGKSPKTQTPLEMLASWGAYYGMSGSALLAMLRSGKLLIIFDGFDEMDGLDDERMRYDNFVSLWTFSIFENSKILITGRPELFLDDSELRRDLAVHPDFSTGPFTRVVKLQRFDEPQIRDALRSLDERSREEIVELALADSAFMDIVSRPSLLLPVAAIWKDPALTKNRNKINSALVIELFLQSTFHRQAEKARADRSHRFMRLTQSELAFFTHAIAVYMAKERLPNQITNTQLSAAALKVWQAIGDSFRFEARPELGEDPAPIKLRLKDVADPVELITTNIRSYGVIVRDYSRGDTFKFSHKSYFELLAGKTAAQIILNSKASEHALIMNCLSPTINDLLVSPVAASFCGESMAITEQEKSGNPIFLLDKIYDFMARPGLGRLLPRAVHKLINVVAPTRILAARIVKLKRSADRDGDVDAEQIIMGTTNTYMLITMSLMLMIAAGLAFGLVFLRADSLFILTDQSISNNPVKPAIHIMNWVSRIFSPTLGLLVAFLGMGLMSMSSANLFRRARARSLLVLSEAAVGKAQTQKYYGRKFCHVVSVLFWLRRA